MREKRLKIVHFDPEEPCPPLSAIVTGARWKDGSEVVESRHAGRGAFEVKLSRSDWPVVPEGGRIPFMFLCEALAEGIEYNRPEIIPCEELT